MVVVANQFEPGQMVTVFRSRLRPDNEGGYHPVAEQMSALAASMPGLIDVKTFAADDGERVTVVTFADEVSQRAWRDHPEHALAQARGRTEFYEEFTIQVCETVRTACYP